MKKSLTIFLQAIIMVLGICVLAFMLWEPHLEGRNVNATPFEIYFNDSFLAYVYIASIFFFIALYKAFRVLGYVRQNKTFSQETLKALRAIKHCAIVQAVLIIMAAAYIRLSHAKDDDPAGFVALCIAATFISTVIAKAASVLEKRL